MLGKQMGDLNYICCELNYDVNYTWLRNDLWYGLKIVVRGKDHMIYIWWGNKLWFKFHVIWNNKINWIYSWNEKSYEINPRWKETLNESVWMIPINFKVVRNKLYIDVLN